MERALGPRGGGGAVEALTCGGVGALLLQLLWRLRFRIFSHGVLDSLRLRLRLLEGACVGAGVRACVCM